MKTVRYFALLAAAALLMTSAAQYPVKTVSKIKTDKKIVALTFDDGPHPTYTDEILDILSEYGVKATFFVIGKNADEHPDIVRRECNEGHEIGNHSYDHAYMNKLSASKTEIDINKCEESVKSAVSTGTKLLRPPGGICSTSLKNECARSGRSIVLWSIDTRDWTRPPSSRIVDNVLNNVSPGDIILMHDYVSGKSSTPDALRIIIPSLIDEGYDFVTVSELIETATGK